MDKKEPTKCNHCDSTDIAKQTWGRSEFWFCRSCKKEPVYTEPEAAPTLFGGSTWDPKHYGFSPYTSSSDAFYFDDSNDSSMDCIVNLPKGFTVDISKYFKGN
jgi:hypothetical protein